MHDGRGKKRLRQLFVEIFHLFFCALPEIREGKRGGVENIYIQVERRGRTWRTLPKTAANVGEAPRERRGSPVADRYSGYYEHSLDPKGQMCIRDRDRPPGPAPRPAPRAAATAPGSWAECSARTGRCGSGSARPAPRRSGPCAGCARWRRWACPWRGWSGPAPACAAHSAAAGAANSSCRNTPRTPRGCGGRPSAGRSCPESTRRSTATA